MASIHDIILRKLSAHSFLVEQDVTALKSLKIQSRSLAEAEDVVRQGDSPQMSVVVLKGYLARYHMLPGGERQYLSFHIAGDMPDAQGLMLRVMDHAVCAISASDIGLIPHKELLAMLHVRPSLGYAIWRETLIDAAIFRMAITNNSARSATKRLAHFFCEQYCRSEAVGLVRNKTCSVPLSQTQIGQALGMSFVTSNRSIQKLRKSRLLQFKAGKLTVINWAKLAAFAEFDAAYLHLNR